MHVFSDWKKLSKVLFLQLGRSYCENLKNLDTPKNGNTYPNIWTVIFFAYSNASNYWKMHTEWHCRQTTLLLKVYTFCPDLSVQIFRKDGSLMVLHPFQQYFNQIRMMEGSTWKALCNKVLFRFGKKSHLQQDSNPRLHDLKSWVQTPKPCGCVTNI